MNQLYSKLSYQHDYLLILRGLLALTVVLHHWGYGVYLAQKTGFDFFKYLAPDGGYSVAGFFVISGYLMSKVLNTKYNCRNGTWHYFYNRILRIFPIYYFASVFAIIVNSAFGSLSDLLPNLESWRLFAPIVFPNNAPLWSICTEMQFYTVAPLIYLFSKNKKNLKFYLLTYASVLAINLVIRMLYMYFYPSQFTLYTSLEVNLLYFLTGWIAYLARNQLPKYPPNLCILLILLEIFILWGWDVHYRQVNIYGAFNNPIWYYVMPMVLSIIFFILLPSLDQPIRHDSHMRSFHWLFKILVFLGITSYSAYAIHAPFPHIIPCIEDNLGYFSIKLPHLFYLYVFSYGLYFFIEKPFMRIKI